MTDTVRYPSGRPSYSHSSLEYYNKCGEFYRLFYLDTTVPKPFTKSEDQLIGQVVHSALELYYKGGFEGRAIPYLEQWWRGFFKKHELHTLWDSLREYQVEYEELKFKASEEYYGEDKIRTKDGKVPKNASMTDDWKKQYKSSGLAFQRKTVDDAVAKREPSFYGVSASEVFRESFKVLDTYVHPKVIKDVYDIESRITGVRYPETQEPVAGLIDLVGKTTDGYTVVADHKTSARTHRDAYKVSFSDQLMLYGWAYSQMTGDVPDYIAINFVRSGDFVSAPFILEEAEESIRQRENAIKAIKAGVFLKRNPIEYGSPCYNENSKMQCPYLSVCHPKFYDAVTRGG